MDRIVDLQSSLPSSRYCVAATCITAHTEREGAREAERERDKERREREIALNDSRILGVDTRRVGRLRYHGTFCSCHRIGTENSRKRGISVSCPDQR